MANSLQVVSLPFEAALTGRRWYACYTKARHEKQVEHLFQQRGIESFLPLVPRMSQWKDRRKLVQWPLFPSYVFGRFVLAELHEVLSVPGVATIVRLNGQPTSVPDDELENVRRFAAALQLTGVEAQPRPYVHEGQWVTVVDGPFLGVRGLVVERRTRRRVLVGLDLIGRGMEVDIDTRLLRPDTGP